MRVIGISSKWVRAGIEMQIIKKVLVKQVITENSKAKIKRQFENEKMQLDQECQQLRFEQKKLERKKGSARMDIMRRFEQEIAKRKEKMKLLDFKMEQLDKLGIGAEIVQNEIEAIIDVEVGTNWDALMSEQAIVIKDGVCVRIDRAGD